jgi:urocanate hydratase
VTGDPPVRLVEVLGALSLATDLGMGQPLETGLGICTVALALAEEAQTASRPCSIGLVANAAEALPALVARGLRPDVVTDQTAAHDAQDGYVPCGLSLQEAAALRERDPAAYERAALASIVRHVEAMLAFQAAGAVVFEYGNAIREQAARAGLAEAFDLPGYVPLFIRPNFCRGRGPCRWVALSGDPDDLRALDEAVAERFAEDRSVVEWIALARERVPQQGLPARTCWLGYEQRLALGTLVNELVGERRLSAPVALSRDHLDAGSVAQPTRETEQMLDGSDAVADWPLLNGLLNAAGGADLVALHQGGGSGMGGSISAGLTLILDGSEQTQRRLERVLRSDPGLGVIRHADAGYQSALELVQSSDLRAPMLSPVRAEARPEC